jgi:hypothetical protein
MEYRTCYAEAFAEYGKNYSQHRWLPLPLEWSFWLHQLNPFQLASVEQVEAESFIEKISHARGIFLGFEEPNYEPSMQKNAGISEAWDYFRQRLIWETPGILDYCLLFSPAVLDTFDEWINAHAQEEESYLVEDQDKSIETCEENTDESTKKRAPEVTFEQKRKFKPWMAHILRAPSAREL